MTNIENQKVEATCEMSLARLEGVKEKVGFIPNVYLAIAKSPCSLAGFVGLAEAFSESSFTTQEQQIIQLAASTENECGYCVAGHTAFADTIGIPEAVVSAMREKRPVPDARLDALSKIVRSLVRSRGHIRDVEIRQFVDAGYTRAQFIEVILGVSLKTFTNYASVALNIPLDAAFREYAWQRTEEIGCAAE
jgi:AhpD family alkylhydroperoxidase